jgi:hypothetical protein
MGDDQNRLPGSEMGTERRKIPHEPFPHAVLHEAV